MALVFPRRVEEKLGEEATREFISWLEAFIREKGVSRDEFREVLSRLDRVEQRLEGVEGRLDRLEEDLRQFRREVNERFQEVERRFDFLNARLISTMKWTVGTVLGMGSLLAILMSIYKFMG